VVGPDDPQRYLPTPTILWFCDSVSGQGILFMKAYLISQAFLNKPQLNSPFFPKPEFAA